MSDLPNINRPDINRPDINRIAVLGAGAWGTALALVAARAGRPTLLWAHEPDLVEEINTRHTNSLYLPGHPVDVAIRATNDLTETAGADALLLVAPAQHVRALITSLGPHLKPGTPVIICAKGIEQETNQLMSQVVAEAAPQVTPAVLSGPSFAADVAQGLPTAVTLACADENLGASLSHALGRASFRPYWSPDLIGAQIGGAVKNVLAIACGIVEGKQFGDSARAALTTRGFAEMSRLGQALGANPETLGGLSGLGDLILTCTSRQSRNMSLGLALGEGKSLSDILGARRSVSEGVHTASVLRTLARTHKLDLPICEAVAAIVSGETAVDDAITALLARPFTSEI